MAINRKSFSSIIPADQQAKMAKVIVCNTTPRGYLHLVTVRTDIVNEQEVEKFTDVMIHPDRAPLIDVAKFDAVSLQGLTPRLAAGEAKPNTTYHWGQDAKAIGRHLVEQAIVGDTPETEKQVLVYAGVGIYGVPEPTVGAKGFGSDQEQAD
jgi:hypothetical protein